MILKITEIGKMSIGKYSFHQMSQSLLMLLISQLLLISIFLLSQGKNHKSNRLLGAFFLAVSLALTDNLLLQIGFYFEYPFLANWSGAFPLLYGPFLLLYTRSLIYKDFRLNFYTLGALLPFAVTFLFSVAAYLIQPPEIKLGLITAIANHTIPKWSYVIVIVLFGHFFFYAGRSFWLINAYTGRARNKFSNLQRLNLDWLSATILFFIALFVVSILNNLFAARGMHGLYDATLLLITLSLFVFSNRVLFGALKNPGIFSWMVDAETVPAKRVKPLPPDRLLASLKELNQFMETKKPYLDPDLNVELLARSLSIRPKELSLMINEGLGQNFFDHINRYRIEEAKRLLTNLPDQKTTVLEILYQTGYNSKSSFNTLFKKYTGLTPSEFKKRK